MKMSELAPVIRSKNAGPYWFTVDIIFITFMKQLRQCHQ